MTKPRVELINDESCDGSVIKVDGKVVFHDQCVDLYTIVEVLKALGITYVESTLEYTDGGCEYC